MKFTEENLKKLRYSEKTYLKENSPYYEDKFNTQREVQPELRQMVFEIDGYGCQRC